MSALLDEAAANLLSPALATRLLLATAVLVGLAQCLVTVGSLHQLEDQESELTASGATTLLAAAAVAGEPAYIDVRSCEALASNPWVLAAGVIVPRDARDFPTLGRGVPVVAASASLAKGLSGADVVVGAAFPEAQVPRFIVGDDGESQTVVRGARLPEGIDMGSAVTTPLPPWQRDAANCVVWLTRHVDVAEANAAVAAELRVRGGQLRVRPAASSVIQPDVVYAHRVERFSGLALGGLLGLVFATVVLRRSRELSCYRLAGVSTLQLSAILWLECLGIAGVALLTQAVATLVMGLHGDRSVLLSHLCDTFLASLVVGIPFSARVAHRRLWTLIRES